MSDNTFESNQNLEVNVSPETVEAHALEDATHEPGARVEQTQDVSTAEAIEQVFTASMDQQDSGTAAGEVQKPETTARDPLTGKGSGPGFNNGKTVLFQQVKISLDSTILIHVRIHGGTDEFRCGDRQHERGQGVVGNTVCQFPDNVRSGRSNHHSIRLIRPLDMPDGCLTASLFRFEKVCTDRGSRQRCEGRLADEFKCIFCHHYTHMRIFFNEKP